MMRRHWLAPALSASIVLLGGPLLSDTDGQFWPAADPLRPGYVGSAACASCHAQEAEAWAGSHHDMAMAEASPDTVLGDFDDAEFDYFGTASRFFRRDDGYWVRTDGPDGQPADYQVSFTFGVAPLQQYLVAFPDGRLQALGLAWDTRPEAEGGQRWFHLYPDSPVAAGDPLHWTGRNQTWNWMCADCHSTHLVRGLDRETRHYATRWAEIDVGCEACHGRGAAHVAWAEAGGDFQADAAAGLAVALRRESRPVFDEALGVVFPGEETGRNVQVDTCAACHSRRRPLGDGHHAGTPFLADYVPALLDDGLYHADGQILDEVFVWGSFVQSRMHRAGVVCSDCHEPHSLALRADGNDVCSQCHLPDRFDVAAHHHHETGTEGAQCVACHMPAQTYMVVDPRRDHSFRIPRPDLSAAFGTPDACTACHGDRDARWAAEAVAAWTGGAPDSDRDFAAAIHAGRTGAPGAWNDLAALAVDGDQPGIVRATAISLLPRFAEWLTPAMIDAYRTGVTDGDPLVRLAAAAAVAPLPPQQRLAMVAHLLDDPVRAVRIAAARQLAQLSGMGLPPELSRRFERAVDELIASELASAERPDVQTNLGTLYAMLRRWQEAEQAFRRAIDIDPAWIPAYVNLSEVQRALGRESAAEETLRQAVAAVPDAAEPYHALGLSLVRQRRYDDALQALETAWRNDPDNGQFGFVYAVALNSLGDTAGAIAVLDGVVDRHPAHRQALMSLAQLHRDTGDLASARGILDRLRAYAPDDPEIAALADTVPAPASP